VAVLAAAAADGPADLADLAAAAADAKVVLVEIAAATAVLEDANFIRYLAG